MYNSYAKLWQPYTAEPLRGNAIHVWYMNFSAMPEDISLAASLLNEEESARAYRFVFAQHTRRFILARAGLRMILARYLALQPAQLTFNYGQHGKPALPDYPDCQFNLSHSENVALFAITFNTPLGIDIEFHKTMTDQLAIAERYFSQQEYHQLKSLHANEQLAAFFRIWTRKEAFIKAVGQGLSYPLDQFSVSILADEPAALLDIYHQPEEISRWAMHAFIPENHYTAALAIPRRENILRFFEFDKHWLISD